MSFTSKLVALFAVASMPLAACTYNTYNTTNEYTTPTSSSSAAPSSSSTSPSSDAAPQSDAGQSETSSDAGSDATPDPYGCYQLGQDPSGSFCSPGCAYVDGKPYHGPAVSDFCLCMVSGQLSCTSADAGSDAADSANDSAPTDAGSDASDADAATVTPGTATIVDGFTAMPTRLVQSGVDAWTPFTAYQLCAGSTEDVALVGLGVSMGNYGYPYSSSDVSEIGVLWNDELVGSTTTPAPVAFDFTKGIVASRGTCTQFLLAAKIPDTAQSGHAPSLGIYGDSASNTLSARVVGMQSGQLITVPFGSAHLGLPMVIRKCVPIITKQSLSSTTLGNIDQEMYKFQIATMRGCSAAFKQIAFDVTKTAGLTLTNFRLRRGSLDVDPSQYQIKDCKAAWGYPGLEDASVTNSCISVLFTNEEIVAGSGNVYSLHATVSGAQAGSSLVLRLLTDSSIVTGQLTQAAPSGYLIFTKDLASATGGGLIWSDMSSPLHDPSISSDPFHPTSSADWTNGSLVNDLSQSQVLSL